VPQQNLPLKPLDGVRVLDVSTMLAGPYGATLLGDMGADVVKVESHLGDDSRRLGAMRDGECGPFLSLNRNKRAVVIDMQLPEGQQVFARLVATADVLITNVRGQVLERLGLGYEQVKAHRPDIVWIGVSAFGPDGPYADRAANGTVAEAFTGLTGLTGAADGAPQLPSAPLGDAMAAAFGAFGALAGVVRALQTGQGATVDVTVYEPLLHALGTTLAGWQPGTPPPARDGGAMGVPLRGTFATADGGWIAISASTPRHQQSVADLATAAGVPADGALRDRAGAWLAGLTTQAALDALVAARVSATVVNDLAAMAADPQVQHRRSLQALGGHPVVRPTPVIDGPDREPFLPPLGDANDEVLRGWLGLSEEQMANLRECGVI